MLAINETLQQRYRIIRQLGHGGMGAVYEARDERLGSMVALKEIIVEIEKIPTEKQREAFRRAFEREAKLLANLHHEVFPRVMDYFSEQNRQFLIMELVAGEDLGERLHKSKTPFAFSETVQLADHLLDALDYLHTQNPPIFHRDIKPQNLKITVRGRIKLLDFGIAKSVDQNGSTITNQTFVGATLDYAPIEQILPAITPTFREFIVLKHGAKAQAVLNQNTDARCDLYAVGATFYHLLTGHAPVDSAKRTLEVWEDNRDPLLDPRQLNAEIPANVSAWLLNAMEIDRANRFSSAAEMRKALQKAVIENFANPAEKTAVLSVSEPPEPENAPTEIDPANFLDTGQSQIKTEPKIILATQNSLSDPFKTATSGVSENLPVKTGSFDPYQTKASENIKKTEKTGAAYFNEKLFAGRTPEPSPARPVPPTPQAATGRGFKFLWAAPVLLVGLVAFGSIGGLLMMNSGNSSTAPANTTVPINLSPTVSNTPMPSPSSNQQTVKEENSTTTPTQTKTPNPNSVKTPTPGISDIKPTQKSEPKTSEGTKKRNLSDDCIYNKRCK